MLDIAPDGLWLYISCIPLLGICPGVMKGSLLPGTFLIPPKGSLFGSYGILPIISGMFIPCWYGAFGVMEFRFGNAESLTSEKGSCTLTALFLPPCIGVICP